MRVRDGTGIGWRRLVFIGILLALALFLSVASSPTTVWAAPEGDVGEAAKDGRTAPCLPIEPSMILVGNQRPAMTSPDLINASWAGIWAIPYRIAGGPDYKMRAVRTLTRRVFEHGYPLRL